MPLTEEQKAALAVIATVDGADIEEAAEELKNRAHPVYQRVFNAGHATARNKADGDRQTIESQLQEAKDEAERLRGELDELKASQPDRAAIDAQWQKRLDAEVKKVSDQLEAASAKVARLTTDTTAEKVENALLKAGFRPKMAKLMASANAARISYDDEGRPVLNDPDTGTPIQVPSGKTAFEHLAETEKSAADPADLVSRADSGAGVSSGGSGGGNPFERIREQKKAEQEKKASFGKAGSAA